MPRILLGLMLVLLVVVLAIVAVQQMPASPTGKSFRPAVPLDVDVIDGPPQVKLAVLVVFDQLRGDYLPRWQQYFPAGGFERFLTAGGWYSQCYYPYAITTTGPGHAAIATGTTPARNGIINNEWYDRTAGASAYCAGSDRFDNVTSSLARSGRSSKTQSGSPERMIGSTVGDHLKASGRGGKVIGVSLKDRSAIFPAGRFADAAYWFSSEFITSTYYRDVLPPWVRSFNASRYQDQWFGQQWTRFRPDLDYNAIIGPDRCPGARDRYGLGPTFPHPVTGGKPTLTKSYYEALTATPFGNDLLLEFAKQCIVAEQLGQRGTADLLTISFSSNDLLGHIFGPDSHEVFDVTLRSDRTMADLFAFLDDRVGSGNYLVVVTADHGIAPLPEMSAAKGLPAKRVPLEPLRTGAEQALTAKYGKPIGTSRQPARWIEDVEFPWFYLNLRQIAAHRLDRAEVAASLADWLRQQSDIHRAFTAEELSKPLQDSIARLARESYHPERSGDVCALLHPYCLLSTSTSQSGTHHGSPYDYDRHVPLLVYGPGQPRGEQPEPVTPMEAATILARALGVKKPN